MKVLKRMFVALISTVMVGCTTVSHVATPTERTGIQPAIGATATATVGSSVFREWKYLARPAAVLTSAHSMNIVLGQLIVAPGDALVPLRLDGREAFCTERRVYVDPLVGPQAPACFLDVNEDGRFELVKVRPGAVWFDGAVNPPLSFERSERMLKSPNSYNYELLYQGTSAGTLRLAYREFQDDLAKPAFFQDLTYGLEKDQKFPMTISFRTVRIEIISGDNNQLVYRVLSGFLATK